MSIETNKLILKTKQKTAKKSCHNFAIGFFVKKFQEG